MAVISICFMMLIDEPLQVVTPVPFVLYVETVQIDRVVQALGFAFISYWVLNYRRADFFADVFLFCLSVNICSTFIRWFFKIAMVS